MKSAGYNVDKAEKLYRWNSELSGVLHEQIGIFEVIVRNAMDRSLSAWCQTHYGTGDWTSDQIPSNDVHVLVAKPLRRAREQAVQASHNRRPGHPRKGVTPGHDDVVAQLTLGSWSTLLGESPACSTNVKKTAAKNLWSDAFGSSFSVSPAASSTASENQRREIGSKLQRITELRNRVAHHENLLEVRAKSRLNDMIAVITALDPRAVHWFINGNKVRSVAGADPRRKRP